MPRNASGTFSLVSGNPVVSGTLIDATWANNTLNDIANEMTDSLSRSGEGGMLAPLRLTDGVQATPGLGFTNEPGSGIYRAGTNEWWSVAGGAQVQQHTANGAVTRFAAGAVGTPSLSAFGDVNTGLWFPAADTLAASVGGVEGWRLNSAGNLGIGTSSPAVKLEVLRGSEGEYLRVGGDDTGNNGRALRFTSATNGGFIGALHTLNAPSSGGAIAFATNSTERARLDSSGNLGIGTSSPGYKLDVRGITASGNGTITTGFSWDTGGLVGSFSNHSLGFLSNGLVQMRLDTSGNLGIGTSSPAQRLDVTGAGNSVQARFGAVAGRGLTIGTAVIAGTNDAGVIFNAPITEGTLIFQTNSTERMRLDSSGNLGIGTSSPGHRLTVDVGAGSQNIFAAQQTGVSNGYTITSNGTNLTHSWHTAGSITAQITANGSFAAGAQGALATTATNGFLYVPTCAGVPTGTPTVITGLVPIVVDTTNNRWYFYSGGAWRNAGP